MRSGEAKQVFSLQTPSKLPSFGRHAPPRRHAPACPSRRSFPGIRGHPSHSQQPRRWAHGSSHGLHTQTQNTPRAPGERQQPGFVCTESNTDPAPSTMFLHAPKGCKIPEASSPSALTSQIQHPSLHSIHFTEKGANFVGKSHPGPATCCNLRLEAASLAKLCKEDTGAAPELCTQFLPSVPPIR